MNWPLLLASLPAGALIGWCAAKIENALYLPSRVQPWPPEGCSSATDSTAANLVKDRDPGSSAQLHRADERSPGRSESLTYPDHKQPQVIGVGEALFPRPSDPLAKGGDDKGQGPLVLGQTRDPVAIRDSLPESVLLAIVILIVPIVMFFAATTSWPTP